MREYILTEKERETALALVEKGLKLNGFRMLRHRVSRALPRLKEDLELIEKFIKVGSRDLKVQE